MERKISKNNLILVCYLDVRYVESDNLYGYLDDFYKNMSAVIDDTVNLIIVPIRSESRVECINPVLLNEEQYKKTEEKVKNLQEDFFKFLEKKND